MTDYFLVLAAIAATALVAILVLAVLIPLLIVGAAAWLGHRDQRAEPTRDEHGEN